MRAITEENCKEAEFYETPAWAIESILDQEYLEDKFIDPCFGFGVLTTAVMNRGYRLHKAIDKSQWGHMPFDTVIGDFLEIHKTIDLAGKAVVMNPPFSKATEFVEASLGADKILCFQRFAWWESAKRRDFWEKHPPARVYICGNRATCWRADIPENQRNSGTTTAHAWFVWDKTAEDQQTTLHHIWKG